MRNLNYLFNKEYYDKLGTSEFEGSVKDINKIIKKDIVFKEEDFKRCNIATDTFIMKTCYPGLIVGLGNPHGVGKTLGCDDEVNTGFSFDYVTGQPYIPGSSVKGMLRSYFKNQRSAVREILSSISVHKEQINADIIGALESEIFDNKDVFFDAVIYDGDKYGKILGFDYITPHQSPIKNPIPIKILKIMPDVRIEFRFRLSDHTVKEVTFDKEEIKKLFSVLLELFGIGAKTNVGYGILKISDGTRLQKEGKKKSNQKSTKTVGSKSSMIKCPKCGQNIHKYQRDKVTPNKFCYFCKASLL